MAGRGTRDQSVPVATIFWVPQKGKANVTRGEILLNINDEKNLESTIVWIKAMWTRFDSLNPSNQQ